MYRNVSARASVAQCTTSHGLPTPTGVVSSSIAEGEERREQRTEENVTLALLYRPVCRAWAFPAFSRRFDPSIHTYRVCVCVCVCVSVCLCIDIHELIRV